MRTAMEDKINVGQIGPHNGTPESSRVSLDVTDSCRNGAEVWLRPTEARQLAAELIRVADDIAPRGIDDDPLLYAIAVIESYQGELRNSAETLDAENIEQLRQGKTLAEIGFCQGTIYTEALGRIRELAKGQQ